MDSNTFYLINNETMILYKLITGTVTEKENF